MTLRPDRRRFESSPVPFMSTAFLRKVLTQLCFYIGEQMGTWTVIVCAVYGYTLLYAIMHSDLGKCKVGRIAPS